MITIKSLSKTFNKNGFDNMVLDNVNLKINRNDFTVIMGSSGAGKSTLLYLLSGLDKTTSGEIYINNTRVDCFKEKQWALFRRKSIGFIHQGINLIPDISIFDNIVLSGYLTTSDRKYINENAKKLMSSMAIEKIAGKYPAQTSGGEQQRAAIARAIITNPDVLFADEPTGALNSKNGKIVLDLLTKINSNGQSIVMVTHDIKAACRANRIIFMCDGQINGDLNLDDYKPDREKTREKLIYNWLEERGW